MSLVASSLDVPAGSWALVVKHEGWNSGSGMTLKMFLAQEL